jgi:putative DNA primase/helicase
MRFLDSLSGGQKDHTEYLIRLCGYFMTGDVSHRGFYISWGVGRNGKSSLVNILKEILGKFFVSISEDVFIKKDKAGGGATPELMPLIGARFAVLSETDEKEKLNSKRIKSLTGSDTISARALYKDQINFVPHCKIMMLTNVKPEFDADDQALIDRLNFIPFPARFNKNRENTKYIESLTTDYLDQFFTLFCQGAKQWSEDGEMMDSKICIDGKIKYQQENDTLRDFITGHTVEEKGQTIPSKDLFNAYKSYCSEHDIRPITVQKFSFRVENEFYGKHRGNKGFMFMNCRFINGNDLSESNSSPNSSPNPLL